MTREVRALLLVALGAALLHLSLFSDTYLRYVRKAQGPYLVASGAVLVLLGLVSAALAVRDLPRDHDHDHDHHHGGGRIAWLLTLPVLAVFLIAPGALGSYTAQRADTTTIKPTDTRFPPLPAGDPVALTLADFDVRAVWDRSGSLRGHRVRLTGFATPKPGGGWYLARLTISCCAADARASKVEIRGIPAPPQGTWLQATGVWQSDGTGTVPLLAAQQLTRIPAPADPYE